MSLGSSRPFISLKVEPKHPYGDSSGNFDSKKTVMHNGERCRVVLRQNVVSVGCSDVTPEALRHILEEWEKRFGNSTIESYEL